MVPENPPIQHNPTKEPIPNRRTSPRVGQNRPSPGRFDERSETRRVRRIPSGDEPRVRQRDHNPEVYRDQTGMGRQRDDPEVYRDQTGMGRSSLEKHDGHQPSGSKSGIYIGCFFI